jgi:hypothetical protein
MRIDLAFFFRLEERRRFLRTSQRADEVEDSDTRQRGCQRCVSRLSFCWNFMPQNDARAIQNGAAACVG